MVRVTCDNARVLPASTTRFKYRLVSKIVECIRVNPVVEKKQLVIPKYLPLL